MRTIIPVLFTLFLSPFANADECENILALSKVTSSTIEDKSSFESHASNFCKEYQSGKSVDKSKSYGLSYKFLSASMGSSNTSAESVASKYCSATNTTQKRDSAYRQYVETISPNAFSAYEQCIRMSKQDLKFSLDVASLLPEQFSLAVSYSSKDNGADADLRFTPSEGVKCVWLNKTDNPVVLDSGKSDMLSCTRKDKGKKGYVQVIRTDTGQAQFLTIPWIAYDKNDLPIDRMVQIEKQYKEMLSQNQEAISKLDKVENRLKDIGNKNCSWGGWVDKAPLSINARCPAGKYVKSIGMKHANHAPWWTEDVRVECCGL